MSIEYIHSKETQYSYSNIEYSLNDIRIFGAKNKSDRKPQVLGVSRVPKCSGEFFSFEVQPW